MRSFVFGQITDLKIRHVKVFRGFNLWTSYKIWNKQKMTQLRFCKIVIESLVK